MEGASELAKELEDDAITLSSSGSKSRKSSNIDLSSSVRPLGVTSSLDIFSNSLARDSESTLAFSASFSGGFSGSGGGGVGGGEGDRAGEGIGEGSPPAILIALLSSTACISGVLWQGTTSSWNRDFSSAARCLLNSVS